MLCPTGNEWMAIYCLRWWNGQQFFQCFGLDVDRTTRRSVFSEDAAEMWSVGVARRQESIAASLSSTIWRKVSDVLNTDTHTSSSLLPSEQCRWHNAADLSFPLLLLVPDMVEEQGCCGNYFTVAIGALMGEGDESFVGNRKQISTVLQSWEQNTKKKAGSLDEIVGKYCQPQYFVE